MLCTFGLTRCLVLSIWSPPPHPSNCPRKEALLILLIQVAQCRWPLVPIPKPSSFCAGSFSPRNCSQLTFLHWDLMLRPGSWTWAAWKAERGVSGLVQGSGSLGSACQGSGPTG